MSHAIEAPPNGRPPGARMRLADFVLHNREPILAEWEAFALTCVPSSGTMNIAALRDHANAMLTAIVADLDTTQGPRAQAAKSKGQSPAPPVAARAGTAHGAGRAQSGFSMEQVLAEYRALRASVIRMWTAQSGEVSSTDVEDLTRFNEAIDESLAISVNQFAEDVHDAKETFLAILGHDLRTPLGAIQSSATFMLDTGELEEPHRTLATRIAASAKRATTMVGELLDFTRSRLGGGIPLVRAEMSLGRVVRDVVDEVAAGDRRCQIRVDTRGDQRGHWDAGRLSQALSNVIGNAVQHGMSGTAVTVQVTGEAEWVAVAVHNRGAVITPDQLDGIFNPMKVARPDAKRGPVAGLGLGLYIAERIVSAHDGRIDVASSEMEGTTFTVHLPRKAVASAE
jgi:signal transduction histidine kinase